MDSARAVMPTAGRSDGLTETAYYWEASDTQIAAERGLDPSRIVRFDTNTSPRTAPSLPDWIARAVAAGRLNEYPDATYGALTRAAAERFNVSPACISVGAGADEVLDLLAKGWLASGSRAVVATPTYGLYELVTRLRGALPVAVPRGHAADGYPLDSDRLLQTARDAAVVWLCDPNNPTGTLEAPGALRSLAERMARLPGHGPLVVVDEAYREFAGASLIPAIAETPRLVVVRTLSKAYGLAGLRVGLAIAQPSVTARLSAVRPPGSIATLSALIAAAALADPSFAPANVQRLVQERERFRAALLDAGWQVPRSVTNFLLLEAGTPAAADAVAERLLDRGFVPRRFGAGPMRACLRLTVRTPEEDAALVATLGAGPGPGVRWHTSRRAASGPSAPNNGHRGGTR